MKETARDELARMARINFENGKARIVNRETGEDATAEFLAFDRFKNLKKRASVEERAKEAGVEDLYNVFYRFMSLDVHGSQSTRGESSDSEGDSIVKMQAVGALAVTSGHVGVRWLVHKQRTDNETLREVLGIRRPNPSNSFQPTAFGDG